MAITGQLTSYNQTVGVKVDMDPLIDILDPSDATLQQLFRDGAPAGATKVEWLNEDLTGQEVTATGNAAGESAAGSTTLVVGSGEGALLRPGDILLVKDATLQVVVASVATDTVTLEADPSGDGDRAFGGTTDAAIADTTVLTIVGQFRAEGGDPEDGRSVDRTSDYNYTQVDQEAVEASRTTRKVKRYGMEDPYDHEVGKKFKELAIRHEKRIISSRRVNSSSAKKRSMGGLFFYITTNSESNTKANIETALRDLQTDCWTLGGSPSVLVVSPAIKAVFDTLNNSRVRETGDPSTGRHLGDTTTRYSSSFGSVEIRMDRYMPKTKAILCQPEFIEHRVMDGFFHELLSKTGDAEKGHIVCEKSLEVRNEKAHGILTITDA